MQGSRLEAGGNAGGRKGGNEGRREGGRHFWRKEEIGKKKTGLDNHYTIVFFLYILLSSDFCCLDLHHSSRRLTLPIVIILLSRISLTLERRVTRYFHFRIKTFLFF